MMMAKAHTTAPASLPRSRFPLLLLGLGLVMLVLVLCIVWSIMLGAADISPQTVVDALFSFDQTEFSHLIIQTVRLPRVLAGVVVGASLAVAGALMQGVTRNPLADSGILGINGGAAFVVVLATYLTGGLALSEYAPYAFIGAFASAAIVYGLASMGRGGPTPLKLTLAGVILTSFLGSITTAILISDQETLDRIRFWTAGSLSGRDMPLLTQTAPYMLAGLAVAMLIARQITTLSLGEDIARGLGQNTLWIRAIAAIAVVLLSGGAVALAGPVGFVGLVVPHVTRFIVGVDYRWIIPYAALFGGILVTISDIGARVVIRPQELPVGVVMAIVGVPFFIWLARWKVKR
jgi:iron complex transport system permease protein